MKVEILQRDSLTLGGFAGLKEHRLVVDQRLGWGGKNAWNGLGNFVYLADAQFLPHGETRLHPHKEVDVISVMVEGRIAHEGSLEHGKNIEKNQVQVQRAGGEGFEHNEINPDTTQNRMIQLWVLPETAGEPAGYKSYDLQPGKLTAIYGGNKDQKDTFDSHTLMEVGLLEQKQTIAREGKFMVYVTQGEGEVNGQAVKDGDLLRGEGLELKATRNMQLILITVNE